MEQSGGRAVWKSSSNIETDYWSMKLCALIRLKVVTLSILNYSCVVLLLALLSACSNTTVEQESQRGVTELDSHVSPQGHNFTLAYMPDAEQVSFNLIWPNRWAHDNQVSVVSSLGVDLMSSGGAGDRSAEQVKRDIIKAEGIASVNATPDHIYAAITAKPADLDDTLDVMVDVIGKPALDESAFEALNTALQQRVFVRLQNPSARLWSATRRVLLGDTPLTDYWNNQPEERPLQSLEIDDVRRWHVETFNRDTVTVAIAGAIETDAAAVAVDRLLAQLPVGKTGSVSKSTVTDPISHSLSGKTVLLQDQSVENTLIAMIGLLPASREGGEVSDIIAVGALGEGKTSRLARSGSEATEDSEVDSSVELPDEVTNELAVEIPEDEGSSISASIANFSRSARVFGISAESDNKGVADTFSEIEQIYTDFKRGNLTDQEVLRGAVSFVTILQKNEQRVDLVAYGLGQLLLDELPVELLLSVTQDTLALGADDINQRIIDRYPDWDSLLKVVISSDKNAIKADCIVTEFEELSACDP